MNQYGGFSKWGIPPNHSILISSSLKPSSFKKHPYESAFASLSVNIIQASYTRHFFTTLFAKDSKDSGCLASPQLPQAQLSSLVRDPSCVVTIAVAVHILQQLLFAVSGCACRRSVKTNCLQSTQPLLMLRQFRICRWRVLLRTILLPGPALVFSVRGDGNIHRATRCHMVSC